MNRRPLSDEHKMRIGATMLDIPEAEYRAKRAAGLKWCFGCRRWKSADPADRAFPRRASAVDGLNNECRDCVNPRARAYMRDRRRPSTRAAGAA